SFANRYNRFAGGRQRSEVFSSCRLSASSALPGHDRNSGGGIEIAAQPRFEAMARKDLFRRGIRTDFAEYRQAARNPGICGPRKVKSVVLGKKKTEHFGAADDGDDAVTDFEPIQGRIEAGADRVPKQSVWMCGIRRTPADPTRQDQTFAARG